MKIGASYGEDEDEALKDGRMRGISLKDLSVLSRFSDTLSGGAFAAIDQRLTPKGNLYSNTRLLTEEELNELLGYAQRLICEAAERIYSGDNSICPVSGVCGFCDYKSVCRMHPLYAGNALRTPPRFDREQLNGGADEEAEE